MTAAVVCMIAQFFQAQLSAPLSVPATPIQVAQMAEASKKECEKLQKEESKKTEDKK